MVQVEEELKIYLRILNAMGDEQVSLQYNTCGNLYVGFLCSQNLDVFLLGQIDPNLQMGNSTILQLTFTQVFSFMLFAHYNYEQLFS